jgi:hypothetical protein
MVPRVQGLLEVLHRAQNSIIACLDPSSRAPLRYALQQFPDFGGVALPGPTLRRANPLTPNSFTQLRLIV